MSDNMELTEVPNGSGPQYPGDTATYSDYINEVAHKVSTFEDKDLEQSLKPDGWEQFKALSQEAAYESLVGVPFLGEGAGFRWLEERAYTKELERLNQPKLSVDEAKELFPDLPIEEPEYREILELRSKNTQRAKAMREWADRGPSYGLPTEFAAGMTQMGDPLNIIATITGGALVRSIGPVAGTLSTSEKTAKVLPKLATAAKRLKTFEPGWKTIAMENFIGNVAVDLPAQQQLEKETGRTVKEMLFGSAAGAVAGTILDRAIFHGGKQLSKWATPDDISRGTRTAVEQVENNRVIDAAHVNSDINAKVAGEIKSGVMLRPYEFRSIEHPSETAFHSGYKGSIEERGPVIDSGEYGGQKFTDDYNVAANIGEDSVRTIEIDPSAKVLDLDKPISDPEIKAFLDDVITNHKSYMKEMGLEPKDFEKLNPSMPLRNIFDALDNEIEDGAFALAGIADIAREKGYSLYKYVDTIEKQTGVVDGDTWEFSTVASTVRKNSIIVLDDSKVKSSRMSTIDKSLTPEPSIRTDDTPPTRFKYDTSETKQNLEAARKDDYSEAAYETAAKEQYDAMSEELAAIDDPQIKEALAKIEEESLATDKYNEGLKEYIKCRRENIG